MAHVIFLWESAESQGDGSVLRHLPREHGDLNSTPELTLKSWQGCVLL